jgi:CubicO group peptidase (beta-lactamase class C family)
MYFPPIDSNTWETISLSDVEWNEGSLQSLIDFVEEKGSKAFIIFKNSKIAIKWYGNGFSQNQNHTWNSVGKTLSAFTIGIAQTEGYLDINESSSLYLRNNWSSLTDTHEKNITIRYHLTMTTGLDYNATNTYCAEQKGFVYKNKPGTYWYYHNEPYTITHDIIAVATNTTFNNYFNKKIKDKIGM